MTSEAGAGSDMDAIDGNVSTSVHNMLSSNAVQEDDEDDDMPAVIILIKQFRLE